MALFTFKQASPVCFEDHTHIKIQTRKAKRMLCVGNKVGHSPRLALHLGSEIVAQSRFETRNQSENCNS